MANTAGDYLCERLAAWGATTLFGVPGAGINGILGALRRQDRLRLVRTRHEEMAAFMACGHLLNGLYDAKRDHQPVAAIVRQAQVTWEQRAMAGDPKLETSPEEPPIPPHMTFKQVEAFPGAPRTGLPGAISAAREFAAELEPGR